MEVQNKFKLGAEPQAHLRQTRGTPKSPFVHLFWFGLKNREHSEQQRKWRGKWNIMAERRAQWQQRCLKSAWVHVQVEKTKIHLHWGTGVMLFMHHKELNLFDKKDVCQKYLGSPIKIYFVGKSRPSYNKIAIYQVNKFLTWHNIIGCVILQNRNC